MKKIFVPIVLLIMFLNGCASYSVYQDSKRQVYAKKVVQAKQNAVKAFADGERGEIGIAIDLTALEVLRENPAKQFGAAILDAALLYGAYEGIQYLNDQSSDSTTYNVTVEGSDNTIVIVDDGQNITISTEQKHDIIIEKIEK